MAYTVILTASQTETPPKGTGDLPFGIADQFAWTHGLKLRHRRKALETITPPSEGGSAETCLKLRHRRKALETAQTGAFTCRVNSGVSN